MRKDARRRSLLRAKTPTATKPNYRKRNHQRSVPLNVTFFPDPFNNPDFASRLRRRAANLDRPTPVPVELHWRIARPWISSSSPRRYWCGNPAVVTRHRTAPRLWLQRPRSNWAERLLPNSSWRSVRPVEPPFAHLRWLFADRGPRRRIREIHTRRVRLER
jgi:hypothetical protein